MAKTKTGAAPKKASAAPKKKKKPAAAKPKPGIAFAVDGQTVTVTVTPTNGKAQKFDHELQAFDSLADRRIVVALVGLGQTGDIPVGSVVADVAAGDLA